jgi:hypothetical protein
MNGATGSDRIINTSMVQFTDYTASIDSNTSSSQIGEIGQIYGTSSIIYYESLVSNGSHGFVIYDNNTPKNQYSPLYMNKTTTTIKGDLGVTGATGSSGNITASGAISATSFTSTSDYRLKQEIRSFGLEEYCVDDLNPVYFKFKQNGKESLGVIAHELQEYYPFLVEGNKDGPNTQSVNYNGLIAVLIKEIQEIKKRVSSLENKIEINK